MSEDDERDATMFECVWHLALVTDCFDSQRSHNFTVSKPAENDKQLYVNTNAENINETKFVLTQHVDVLEIGRDVKVDDCSSGQCNLPVSYVFHFSFLSGFVSV